MTIDTSAPLSIDVVLAAGLRWLYVTARPADAVVERRGACMKTADRVLRFVPVSATDNPLIVVDLLDVHWGLSSLSPPLNSLPPNELPSSEQNWRPCASRRAPSTTSALPAPLFWTHPLTPAWSRCCAVRRYDRGCPRHDSQVCEAPGFETAGEAAPGMSTGIDARSGPSSTRTRQHGNDIHRAPHGRGAGPHWLLASRVEVETSSACQPHLSHPKRHAGPMPYPVVRGDVSVSAVNRLASRHLPWISTRAGEGVRHPA